MEGKQKLIQVYMTLGEISLENGNSTVLTCNF
jgi:hypothetical protein